MVDVSMIVGAVTGLRAAAGMASDLVGIRDHEVLQSKVIDLQRTILDAQSSALAAQAQQSELLDQIRVLNQEVEAAKAWGTAIGRYKLQELGVRSFAYRLKDAFRSEEPDHILCSKCVTDHLISPMNFSHRHEHNTYWDCHTCGKRYSLNGSY